MTNYKNRDKLRFIPPSESNNATKMSDWIMKLVKSNPNVTGLQCFRWGNRNHVGLVAIDADRLRKGEIGSVAFFDGQGSFQDTFGKFIEKGYANGGKTISENGNINTDSFLYKLKSKIDEEEELDTIFIGYCQEVLTLTFGEIAKFIDGFNEGKACPVNIEPLISGYGQKSEETDCSYWIETLYTIYCAGKINDFENFKKFCKNAENINKLISAKETLKKSAKKAEELDLSIDISDYQKIMTQGGVRSIKQFKNPKLFSQIQDKNDQLDTITLKLSEDGKKLLKNIDIIKITPKKLTKEEGLSQLDLIKNIEQSGFTKEILENSIITIKRKNVEHFEPLRNFLLKNINKNLVGYNKGQVREIRC